VNPRRVPTRSCVSTKPPPPPLLPPPPPPLSAPASVWVPLSIYPPPRHRRLGPRTPTRCYGCSGSAAPTTSRLLSSRAFGLEVHPLILFSFPSPASARRELRLRGLCLGPRYASLSPSRLAHVQLLPLLRRFSPTKKRSFVAAGRSRFGNRFRGGDSFILPALPRASSEPYPEYTRAGPPSLRMCSPPPLVTFLLRMGFARATPVTGARALIYRAFSSVSPLPTTPPVWSPALATRSHDEPFVFLWHCPASAPRPVSSHPARGAGTFLPHAPRIAASLPAGDHLTGGDDERRAQATTRSRRSAQASRVRPGIAPRVKTVPRCVRGVGSGSLERTLDGLRLTTGRGRAARRRCFPSGNPSISLSQ